MDSNFTRVDLERCEADIAGVERAVEALNQGTFGLCEVCSAPITAEVKADPLATRCGSHPR